MHVLIQLAAVAGCLVTSSKALLNTTIPWPVYVKYETVTGYFLQDEPDTDAATFDYVRSPITMKSILLLIATHRRKTISD